MYDPTKPTGWLLSALLKAGPDGAIETPYGTVHLGAETIDSVESALRAQFPAGKHVRYVPYHAEGDTSHLDCENGIVSSVRGTTIFVRFSIYGTPQGCKADQLR